MHNRAPRHHASLQHVGAMVLFAGAILVLAILIWMGVAGIGFPSWLLALTTVL